MTTHAPLQRQATRPRSRRRVRTWVKRGLLGALAAAGVGALVYAWLPSPTSVDVGVVSRIALDVEVAEDGQTRVRDRFVVSSPTAGNLERIELDAGTTVSAGDVVARIDPPDPALLDTRTRDEARARLTAAIARLQRAETTVARTKAARELAIKEADRAAMLISRGAISGAERDRLELEAQLAIRDVAAANTERTAAAAEIAGVRALLGDGTSRPHAPVSVTAPSGGRVLRILRDSAGPVVPGTPLLELGDPQAIEVVVDVLSSDATRIRPGMDVAIEAWGGEPLRGQVRIVEPSGFTRLSALGVEEQRVKVVVAIENPPAALGDGFRVETRIFVWRGAAVLAVPASAVFRDRDRWAVYVIDDGRARLRPIEIGHRGRSAIEVTSGIDEGTAIVLHPSDRVSDGARVRPR